MFIGTALDTSAIYDSLHDQFYSASSDNGCYHVYQRGGGTKRGQTGIFQGATEISRTIFDGANTLVVAGGMVISAMRGKFFLKNITTAAHIGHYIISVLGSSFTSYPQTGMANWQAPSNAANITFVTFLSSGIYSQDDRRGISPFLSVIDNSYAITLTSSGEATGVAEAGFKVFENNIVHICTNQIL